MGKADSMCDHAKYRAKVNNYIMPHALTTISATVGKCQTYIREFALVSYAGT